MLLWLMVLGLFVIYVFYVWLKPWIRTTMLAYSLPGPPISPVIDNVFHSRNNLDFLDFLSTAYVKYGPIVKSWIAVVPIIFVLEPKHIQVILGSSKLSEKNFLYNVLKPYVGIGLATHEGTKWKSHRKHIQPFFYGNMLESCIPIFVECTECWLKTLKDGEKIQFTSIMNTYVTNTIYDIIMGVPVNDSSVKAKSFFAKRRNVALERFLKPWLLLDFIFKFLKNTENDLQQTLEQFVLKMAKSIQERKSSKTKWNLLEFLYEITEADQSFQMEDVVNEVCSLILAGQDTTKVTLSFLLYYLAKHQDVQDKVLQEINNVMKPACSINIDMLNELKYLEQCIKEAMRLSPAIPLFARKLLEDVQLGDCLLPAGCNVFISPYATHRIPKYYPDPEKYNPERFSKENQDDNHSFSYIPFSGGPRNCVASKFTMLSMKTVISLLLRSFKVTLESEHEPLIPTYRIALKAKGNIWLILKTRGSTPT